MRYLTLVLACQEDMIRCRRDSCDFLPFHACDSCTHGAQQGSHPYICEITVNPCMKQTSRNGVHVRRQTSLCSYLMIIQQRNGALMNSLLVTEASFYDRPGRSSWKVWLQKGAGPEALIGGMGAVGQGAMRYQWCSRAKLHTLFHRGLMPSLALLCRIHLFFMPCCNFTLQPPACRSV